MNPEPEKLAEHLKKNYPEAEYRSVYEAGFSGFEAHRTYEFLSETVEEAFFSHKTGNNENRASLLDFTPVRVYIILMISLHFPGNPYFFTSAIRSINTIQA